MKHFIFGILIFLISFPALAHEEKESVYDRVMRTGTIRCGYIIVPPKMMVDPVSGDLHGIVYDLIEKIGETLKLKIEWTEESTFATAVEGLRSNRFDMVCTSLYARPNIMPHMELTTPYYYVPVNAYVHSNDIRFDYNSALINQPETKISLIDGTIPWLLKNIDFPQASQYSLPDSQSYSEIMLAVKMGKADVTFVEPSTAAEFMEHNPESLRLVPGVSPIKIYPNVLGVKKGEHSLESMLSWSIRYLLINGEIDKILKNYDQYSNYIVKLSKPYEAAQ